MQLILISFSPIIVLFVASFLVLYLSLKKIRVELFYLIGRSLLYGVISVAISFALTAWWMSHYESSTGFSAGNAPVAWFFFIAPLASAIGQVVALIDWWFKRIATGRSRRQEP